MFWVEIIGCTWGIVDVEPTLSVQGYLLDLTWKTPLDELSS